MELLRRDGIVERARERRARLYRVQRGVESQAREPRGVGHGQAAVIARPRL